MRGRARDRYRPPLRRRRRLPASQARRNRRGDRRDHPDLPARRRLLARLSAPRPGRRSVSRRAREEVAAGEGALRTCRARSVRWTTKSSTSRPSRSTAWARMPDGPGSTSAGSSSGTKRRSSVTNARLLAACRSSVSPVRQKRPASRQVPGQARFEARSRQRTPAEPVGVASADHQRRGAEQDLAVDRPGQVPAEERQVGIGDRVDAGAHQLAPLGAQPQVGAAEGDDPRLGRRAGGDGEPVAPGSRAADHEAGLGRRRRACWTATAPGRGARPRTSQPVTIAPPAASTSAAKAVATRAKSTTPVAGECRAATPRACGSISAISSAPTRRRPGTSLARPRRSSSSSRGQLGLRRWRRSACRCASPRYRAPRSRRRAGGRPRRRAAPSAIPGA